MKIFSFCSRSLLALVAIQIVSSGSVFSHSSSFGHQHLLCRVYRTNTLVQPNSSSGFDILGAESSNSTFSPFDSLANDFYDVGLDFDTSYASLPDPAWVDSEHLDCAPIINGQQLDDLVPLDLPPSIVEEYVAQLDAGTWVVNLTYAYYDSSQGVIVWDPVHSQVEVVSDYEFSAPVAHGHVRRGGRQMKFEPFEVAKTGRVDVIMVLVETLDVRHPLDIDYVKKRLRRRTNNNFVRQTRECSMNKLHYKVKVLTVQLYATMSAFGTSRNELVKAAQSRLQLDQKVVSLTELADRVMFCLPPGTGSWVAFASLNHWRSVYNGNWCLSLSATMHELGHNLGLRHATEDGYAYGDATGYMAASYLYEIWPKRCYNGRQHFMLGWYEDRTLSYDPVRLPSTRMINLVAFVDYPRTSSSDYVVIELSQSLYLHYNRAKHFNRDTGEQRNAVTIHRSSPGGTDILSALWTGDVYRHRNFRRSGETLEIKACRAVQLGWNKDAMVLSIGLGDDSAHCSGDVSFPTAVAKPTPRPSKNPTQRPTRKPTPAPTRFPTAAPSPMAFSNQWKVSNPMLSMILQYLYGDPNDR